MLGATETLSGTIVKVCREDTIFYLFFPYFLCPCPNVNIDCKTVTWFLRFQVRRASSRKKGLEPGWTRRARVGRKAKTTLNRFWEKQMRLFCFLCPVLYTTKVFVIVICVCNCFVISKTFPTSFARDYCRLQSENVKAHKPHWRTRNNYAYLEFGVDFVINRP